MNLGSNGPEEMQSEYDIRGGTRGKYFERYNNAIPTITVTSSLPLLVATNAGSSTPDARIVRSFAAAPFQSPKIQVGPPVAADR